MKSGFYYTKLERNESIKLLKILFKHICIIKLPKMAIIILVIARWFSYDFPMIFPLTIPTSAPDRGGPIAHNWAVDELLSPKLLLVNL